MIKMRLVLLSIAFLSTFPLQAQVSNFWSSINENAIFLSAENDRGTIPTEYETFALELEGMKTYLQDAPMQFTTEARNNPLILELPLPDGEIHPFNIVEAPVMKPGLASRFPQIKSFSGYSAIDKSISVRFIYSTHGFRAFLKTPETKYYIQPYAKNIHDSYIVFDKRYEPIPQDIELACGVSNSDDFLNGDSPLGGLEIEHSHNHSHSASARTTDAVVEMIEYDIAVAGVAEWVNNQGGTVAAGMSSVAIVVTLLNQVLGAEASINFVLVEDNDELIYLDPNLDPYSDISNAGGLLQQNQINLDMTIGTSFYDIGHVMTLSCVGVGGIAGGTVCSSNGKGRGVTCNGGNLENAILNTAVHEIAHQFTAGHTWHNCIGTIGNPPVDILTQRAGGSAFEPGSGSTIMSYQGACGSENIAFTAGPEYYHVGSLQQIYTHSRDGGGSECPEYIPTNNNLPEMELPYINGFFIPISTPFELTANVTDADNDAVTYCWEQYNLGPISTLGNPFGSSPTFRSYPPTDNPSRTFPRIQNIISNQNSLVEVLPTYSRNLKFRCTARDNNSEIGGIVWEEISFEATVSAGPFLVDYPNSNESFQSGDYIEVMWDVANTNGTGVNCQIVDIYLTDNGGTSFDYLLAENVPNDGAHFVTLPNIETAGARIKVAAADNIFFDMSNFNSTIQEPDTSGYAFSPGPYNQQVCAPDDVVIDLTTYSLLGYDSLVTFSVSGLPTGAVANFSSNPVVPADNASLSIDITNVVDNGFYELEITAVAAGGETLVRTVTFDIVLNDFSTLLPVEPSNGSSGVSELPEFSWVGTPNATNYIIEIADNPSFESGSILESTAVLGTTYEPSVILEKNNLYFWRIRAVNECGEGAFSDPVGFHTVIFECTEFENTNNANITGVGLPTIESIITVPSAGAVNDLNITKLKGAHDLVRHLDVSVVAPDQTEVVLFSDICGVATIFNLGLDDQAPSDIQCPPTTGASYKPQGNLSDFNNIDAVGNWTLKITVNNTDGQGGILEEWGMQLCSSMSSENPPFLVNNNLMPLPPSSARQITSDFLLSQDDDNGPGELTYTIVTAPEHGNILFLNQPIGVGSTFRQASLNAGNVKYEHGGGTETSDGFTFAVEDGEGGWFGTPRFEIEVDPDVVLGAEELEKLYNFSVYPNPTQNLLNLEFNRPINNELEISITNVQGQVVQTQMLNNISGVETINTSRLANGIYFIYVKSENSAVATERFVIQR